jgi:IS1 family transposase/transposase-like protein
LWVRLPRKIDYHTNFAENSMNPQPSFCPNLSCPSRGEVGAENLRVHDSLRNRWHCRTCDTTFSGRRGTPFYRLKHDLDLVEKVIILLSYGCPLPAVVAAFGLDERTVALWQNRAGQHCQAVHEALVQTPQDLGQVQADEIRVRLQQRTVRWLSMAICVPTRLWLGAELGCSRDTRLLKRLARRVKASAKSVPLLVVTDGWKPYQEAFRKTFYVAERTGKRGQPRRSLCPQFALAQTVKWREGGRVLGIRVCHLLGAVKQIAPLLPKEQVVNTAYIERLNATFRQRLAGLHRRTRCLRRQETTLAHAVWLVGTVYNFCRVHRSLETADGQGRTPTMTAKLTRHVWSVAELLCFAVAPPPYLAPKRRGRKPKEQLEGFTV